MGGHIIARIIDWFVSEHIGRLIGGRIGGHIGGLIGGHIGQLISGLGWVYIGEYTLFLEIPETP